MILSDSHADMKQLLQDFKTGKTEPVTQPGSRLKGGHVLDKIGDQKSGVGGQKYRVKMLVEFGKAGYIAKAKSRPDKVRQVR